MKTIAAPTAIAASQSRPDVQQVLPRLACSSSLRGRKANTRRTRQDDKPQSRETFAMQRPEQALPPRKRRLRRQPECHLRWPSP
jgi:hypothetical protein